MNKGALENLINIRKLHHEAADVSEVNSLIQSGSIRLQDAQLESLSLENRFDLINRYLVPSPRWRELES